MKNKILCIADSLGLPGHLNKYEDTWFYKLKQEFPNSDFISFFKRQLTTDILVSIGGGEGGVDNWPKGGDCLEAYKPDIVIIQLGIVDCAPRLLNKYDRVIIKILPKILRKPYIEIVKLIRTRNINNTLVPFDIFKSNLDIYIKRAQELGVKIVFISISVPEKKMLEKNKEIISNVTRYNKYYSELENIYSFIKVTSPLIASDYDKNIYEDGYHPNVFGQNIIYNKLKDLLNEFN